MIEHKMLALFGGRMDAYGADGGYAVRTPVTHQLVRAHLEGIGIGIYPTWHDSDKLWCKWGCCDIDTGDWTEAWALATALRSMGMTPFVERSRSKGWHVWVFAAHPVEARTMRRALKVAYAAIGLPAREANPKSEHLEPSQLGNYVRLPFKNGLNEQLDRQVMMVNWSKTDDGEPIQVTDWFNQFDQTMRVDLRVLERWASKYYEPEKPEVHVPEMDDETLKKLVGSLRGDIYSFIKNGPVKDRSQALVALAFKCRKAGYTPQEVYAIVDVAARRWGKYSDRPDRERYILDIVSRTS